MYSYETTYQNILECSDTGNFWLLSGSITVLVLSLVLDNSLASLI